MFHAWLALGVSLAVAPDSSISLDAARLAYVDPGAGSFILQALVALLAGAAVALNVYWKKVKRFFGPRVEDGRDEKKARTDSADG